MAMRDIFTGGACNVNGDSSIEKLQGFMIGDQNGELVQNALLERQRMQIMEDQFQKLQTDFSSQHTLEQSYLQEQQRAEIHEQMMNAEFEHQKNLEMQHRMQIQQNYEQQMINQQQQYEAEQFARQMIMEQQYQKTEKQQEQSLNEDQIVKDNANQMFVKMAADDSPRFKNSKFLSFLNQLRTGELKIQGDQLIQGVPDQKPQDLDKLFENAWGQANQEEQKYQQENKLPDLDEFWAQKINEYEKEREDEDQFTKRLEQEYQDVLKYMNEQGNYDQISDAWQKASDLQEQQLYKDASDHYQFQANNQYLDHVNPMHLALEFMANGKPFDAILALEAHIQKSDKNQNNSNAWRIMGRLHQENDNDQKAVACLLNALKTDNNNPDVFLALGVSCTNILDEVKAMNFLKQWYIISPLQQDLPISDNIIPQKNKEYDDYTIEEIKAMNFNMLQAFEKASAMHPENADLHVSLAVLQYIARNYELSVLSFKNVLQIDPNNYSLWNKLGATLAQLGRADEAIEAYHRALELKPNYVRVWVNLGIAHAYKGDYVEAARLYLNALSFNPEAKHLWSYLQTCFMCMQRFDLVGKIQNNNPLEFQDEFEILKLEELPMPEVDYAYSNSKYLLMDQQAQNWAGEFQQEFEQN
ncbi:hypothetical protein IMG5_184450 [Ichthyophthirius multifiliis]|uniref:Uncharacterized protein n=1 Tax=Ichthyophthirius multifiliis TaxID=5932 RepID=G0R3C4_ICHMU|nr:hypothetical protein IMG5_184450 [Ichthyophthirius multifiliis]EGR28043.1 hypothetical protein IMG5_184450 [Ichthyophthirius multifiliis]|eukprot:XP_004027388.1 hypothetical protein IMG5_184450 [Ichthyophthirius multifiliis]